MIQTILDWFYQRLAEQICRDLSRPNYLAAPLTTELKSVFDDPDLETHRRETAASLLDDDCLGYVVLVVREHDHQADIELGLALSEQMWPALRKTLSRLIVAGEVYR